MTFLFEENTSMKVEEILLQEDLKWYNADYKFVHCDKDRLSRISNLRRNHYWIPVGTLDFVQEALRVFYGVEKINPIEIPKCLRKPAFLGRNYYFVQKENLPKSGVYFIKHVEEAKGFSYSGDINEIYNFTKELPEGLYQVSDFVPDIISEWRAYISRNKILSICNYAGQASTYPDSELIKRMIDVYQFDENKPDSYTMDLAVTNSGKTILIEIHPFVSVGLYGTIYQNKLPLCYFDGIRWCVERNKEIEP